MLPMRLTLWYIPSMHGELQTFMEVVSISRTKVVTHLLTVMMSSSSSSSPSVVGRGLRLSVVVVVAAGVVATKMETAVALNGNGWRASAQRGDHLSRI